MSSLYGLPPSVREALRGKTAQVYVPPAAAGDATKEWPVFYAERACRLLSVGVVPLATITGANTNTFHWNVRNKGTDGNGTTEIGNVDFVSGTNADDYDYREIVAETGGKSLSAGQVLTLQRELIGTGQASPEALVVVVYEYTA